MNLSDAIDYVNTLAFKPGWQPIALPSGYSTNTMLISFVIDTVDTSYPDADGVCRRKIRMAGEDRRLNVSAMSREDICYELLMLAASIDEHENREFLKERRDGEWVAPMHPHTSEGNRAWDRRQANHLATGLMQLLEQ